VGKTGAKKMIVPENKVHILSAGVAPSTQ